MEPKDDLQEWPYGYYKQRIAPQSVDGSAGHPVTLVTLKPMLISTYVVTAKMRTLKP